MTNHYHMPAEWEPQEAVILSWPHNSETWPNNLPQVRQTYAKIISEITDHQDVWLLVKNAQEETAVKNYLILQSALNNRVKFFQVPTHDAWVRDYGPIYVVNDKSRLATDWLFNGWGDKYDAGYFLDSDVPKKISKITGENIRSLDFILEGGSIDVNGEGVLITSKNCLLNTNRNQKYSQKQIEVILSENLGVKKIIWVDGEIKGDDTDGHIDDAARFVNKNTIACIYEENSSDENHAEISKIYKSLKNQTDHKGIPLNIVKLPMPNPVYDGGLRLPASYANFLITNKKVLVPTYNCPNDKDAINILQQHFPTRRVVGIDGTNLVSGFGSIHCLSQQVPNFPV